MPDTQHEEARRCPKCKEPGALQSKMQQPRPTRRGMCTIETYVCDNNRCKNYEDTWIVQLNDDGTIPTRPKGPKEFPNSKRMIDMGKDYLEYLEEETKRGETLGGL